MFFRQMTAAFFVRTDPDSSMVKPAAIHMTSPPQMRKENVLKMNRISSPTMFPRPFLPRRRAGGSTPERRGSAAALPPPESQRAEPARWRPGRESSP